MAEAFANTLRRGYPAGEDLSKADGVLAQISDWMADHNAVAPHSALGVRSPRQYRTAVGTMSPKC
jgi:putative transposase